jgi:hypothetical protein
MMKKELGPHPEIVRCILTGSILQVTFRIVDREDGVALSALFNEVGIPPRAERIRSSANEVTYSYGFGNPVDANTAKALACPNR